MATLLDDLRRENPQFEQTLLNPLLNYLITAREIAGGDLDLNIILMVIGIRAVDDPEFGRRSKEEGVAGLAIFPSRGVNIRSIAESSGIPRETVRRKVDILVRKGWIVRNGANLHFTGQGWVQLAGIREARERLAVKIYDVIRSEAVRLGARL